MLPGRAVTNMWAKSMLYTHTYNNVNPAEAIDPFTYTFPPFISPNTQPVERVTQPSTTTTSTTVSSTTEAGTISPLLDVRITEGCGLANDVQSLVVNGEKTNEGEFPWLVALMYRKGFNYEFRCTANLIDDDHIVTGR